MRTTFPRPFIIIIGFLTSIATSAPSLAGDSPSFFERLANNYGDPKNWIIGGVIGLGIGIIAMLRKKKR